MLPLNRAGHPGRGILRSRSVSLRGERNRHRLVQFGRRADPGSHQANGTKVWSGPGGSATEHWSRNGVFDPEAMCASQAA